MYSKSSIQAEKGNDKVKFYFIIKYLKPKIVRY